MSTTTFAGDHVALTAPAELVAHYHTALRFMSSVIEDPTIIDRVFAWLHSFHDSNLTEGTHVNPLLALVFHPTKRHDSFALIALIIMANHNQDDWLHDRMTFHALAGIQIAYMGNPLLREFADLTRPKDAA